MRTPLASRPERRSLRRWAVAALGVGFSGAAVAHFVGGHGEDAVVTVVTVFPSVALLAFGAWFGVRDPAPEAELAVFTWAVGGAGLVLALDLWGLTVGAYGDAVHVGHVVIQHTSLGALGGAVAGTYSERDRRRARSHVRLQRALDAAMDGVAVLDDEGRVTYANDAYVQYYGGDRDDLVGEHWSVAYPADGRDHIAERIASLDETGHWRGTVVARRAGGGTYPQELSMTALDGGAVWVCRDVTGREEREERLEALNRVLRHNVRNAMNVVLGRADRIARRHGESEDVAGIREAADGVLAVSEKAREVECALEGDDPVTRAAVSDLVATEVERVREEYPSVAFDVAAETDVPVDDRVQLAVRELLVNAAERGGEDARVSVEVEVGESVVVAVTGCAGGLPTNERRAVTGRDETPVRHGSGLGLWLVYWLVRQCGGSVEAPGDGSVYVHLPRERTKVTE